VSFETFMRDYAPQMAHSEFKRRGSENQFLKCSLLCGGDACDIMTVPIAFFTAFQFAYNPYYIGCHISVNLSQTVTCWTSKGLFTPGHLLFSVFLLMG